MIRLIWKRLLKVFLLGAALGAAAGMLNPPKPRGGEQDGSAAGDPVPQPSDEK